jgi:enamine deaminase RidA (YjgF/YER057c/UK114 family)
MYLMRRRWEVVDAPSVTLPIRSQVTVNMLAATDRRVEILSIAELFIGIEERVTDE